MQISRLSSSRLYVDELLQQLGNVAKTHVPGDTPNHYVVRVDKHHMETKVVFHLNKGFELIARTSTSMCTLTADYSQITKYAAMMASEIMEFSRTIVFFHATTTLTSKW